MPMNLFPMFLKGKESKSTPLTGSLSTTNTAIPVADSSVFASAPNTAVIFDKLNNVVETIKYKGISGNMLVSVTRGFGNTAARSWMPFNDSDGNPMVNITNALTSYEWDNFVRNIELLEQKTGAGVDLSKISSRLSEIEEAIDLQAGMNQDFENDIETLKKMLDDLDLTSEDIDLTPTIARITALEDRADNLESRMERVEYVEVWA